MKKSTTGLLIGSALVVGLSGCASSASQSSGQAGANSPTYHAIKTDLGLLGLGHALAKFPSATLSGFT